MKRAAACSPSNAFDSHVLGIEFPSEEVAFNNVGRWTHVKGSEHSGTIHVHITIPQSTDISLDEA